MNDHYDLGVAEMKAVFAEIVSQALLDELRPLHTMRELFGLPKVEPLFEAAQKVVDADGETGR